MRPGRARSLRRRIVATCLVVEAAGLALLLANGTQQLTALQREQAQRQAVQVTALLGEALAAPLAQRDYATVQQILDHARDGSAIDYLVLADHRDRPVAASGWSLERPLPPRDTGIDLDRADTTLHLVGPIAVAGQSLGQLELGLSTVPLRAQRQAFVQRGLWIGAGTLAASLAVLWLLSLVATRRLARLADASQRVAEGDFDVRLPTVPNDELGQLGASFNSMAGTVKARMHALQDAEARQREHLQEVRDERQRLTTLLSALHSAILFVDAEGRVVYGNRAFMQLWGLDALPVGEPAHGLLPHLHRQVRPEDAGALQALSDAGVADARALDLLLADGRMVVQRVQSVEGGGRIWQHRDVTEERRVEHRAREAALDPLTGMLNRRGLLEALAMACERARASGEPLALMFVDLDDFKRVNDLGGHAAGDQLLVAVAEALSAQMRRGELVARLGGDEFAVLCPGLDRESAGPIAQRLVRAVGEVRVRAGEHALRSGCSIGVAVMPDDADTDEALLACADAAMYEAKRLGKGTWSGYRVDVERRRREGERIDWGARVRQALADGRFTLHFQPVVRCADGAVVHHEALLRMVDALDTGLLHGPARFMAHAERGGLVGDVDRWVLAECVQRLAQSPAELVLSANVALRTLEGDGVVEHLAECFRRDDVDPRRLHLEVAQSDALADATTVRKNIARLRALGCRLHLDDFGVGLRAFEQLRLLELDALKIDGAFVRDMATDANLRVLVEAIVRVGHNLGKTVIAEHVEDAATFELLRAAGVDLAQGYHLGRPAATLHGRAAPEPLRLVGSGPPQGVAAKQ